MGDFVNKAITWLVRAVGVGCVFLLIFSDSSRDPWFRVSEIVMILIWADMEYRAYKSKK